MKLSDRELSTICIMHPNESSHAETFILAHIENLPAEVKVLYGGSFPYYIGGGRPLISRYRHHINRILHKVFRTNLRHFENQALRRYLKEQKVKAVLAEYGPTGVNIMDACQAEHIPLIVHFHGVDAYAKTALEQYGKEYRRMFDIAKAVVVVSHDMEKQLLNLGIQKEKLHCNPCGADIELFSGASPDTAQTVFIAVGRFVDKKAPHLTLLSFKKVLEACPDARLIMIGTGELLEACKQLAKALGITREVDFLGNLSSSAEVAAKMRLARAFVQHSVQTNYGDSEGTPVAVLEAGASGLPVVSTRHAGIKDVVIHGETGFLVEEGDINGMAEYMIKLAQNPLLAGKMGRQARERIYSKFSMEKSISNLWNIIESEIEK